MSTQDGHSRESGNPVKNIPFMVSLSNHSLSNEPFGKLRVSGSLFNLLANLTNMALSRD
jgi:hypothetical protein